MPLSEKVEDPRDHHPASDPHDTPNQCKAEPRVPADVLSGDLDVHPPAPRQEHGRDEQRREDRELLDKDVLLLRVRRRRRALSMREESIVRRWRYVLVVSSISVLISRIRSNCMTTLSITSSRYVLICCESCSVSVLMRYRSMTLAVSCFSAGGRVRGDTPEPKRHTCAG